MKNTLAEKIYHFYVKKRHRVKSHRGSWMLAHLYMQDYKKYPLKKYFSIAGKHKKGWSYSDWTTMSLDNVKSKKYLNTRDYCSLHPFNGEYSGWIDDKLTLKYLLDGTKLSGYMPEYYFHIMGEGQIAPLMDYEGEKKALTIDTFLDLLKEKKDLAVKKIKGALGEGFIKLGYASGDDIFTWNESPISLEQLKERIGKLKNYIVTEFLFPHPFISSYCPNSLGSLRYTIGKRLNGDWQEITCFLRIGAKASGVVENYSQGGVTVYPYDGVFKNGHIKDQATGKDILVDMHPDNGKVLEGEIPMMDEIKKVAEEFTRIFPQMSYLGFDFALTSTGDIKLTEVNSLNSLTFQIEKPVYDTPAGEFFKERLGRE